MTLPPKCYVERLKWQWIRMWMAVRRLLISIAYCSINNACRCHNFQFTIQLMTVGLLNTALFQYVNCQDQRISKTWRYRSQTIYIFVFYLFMWLSQLHVLHHKALLKEQKCITVTHHKVGVSWYAQAVIKTEQTLKQSTSNYCIRPSSATIVR